MDKDEADLIEMRRAFQSLGAATKNARSPLHFIFDFRILCNLWLDDKESLLDGRFKQSCSVLKPRINTPKPWVPV